MRVALLATADNNHTRRWAEFLAARVDLLLLSDVPPRAPIPGCHVEHPRMDFPTKVLAYKLTDPAFGNNRFKHRAYLPHLRRFRPDVVHAMEALGYGPVLAHVRGTARVLTPWGSDVLAWPARHRTARRLVASAVAAADLITTNAPGMEDVLLREFGTPAAKLRLFSWGIDTTVFRTVPDDARIAAREALAIPGGHLVILSPRNATEYLGAPIIARAFHRWQAATRADATLVMLRGSAPDAEWAATTAAARGGRSSDSIRLVGDYLDATAMARAYAAADAFVSIPTTDLLAMTILEGMACGALPVLAPLPAYRSRVADIDDATAPAATARGLVLAVRDEEALATAFARLRALAPARRADVAATNAALIAASEDATRNMARMLDVYDEARRITAPA